MGRKAEAGEFVVTAEEKKNMKTAKIWKGLLSALFCGLFLQGCPVIWVVGMVSDAGYEAGKLNVSYRNSFDQTWKASLGALKDLGYKINDSKKGKDVGTINATRADETLVKISFVRGPSSTSVTFAAAVSFGGKEVATAIHQNMVQRLK